MSTQGHAAPAAQQSGSALLRPRNAAEAAQALSGSAGSVLFRGAGTKLDWAGRVPDPDLVMDTTAMTGVLTHNPGDMTASVRAGTPLSALQEHVAGDGQWLALDPPTSLHGATVGGLLSAGDSGPSRLRYGGLRDLVIGVTLVLADGTVARSGGHVIKNVAGYDLSKLVHGSLGSLALIAEVVLRLHPRPAASSTLTGAATAAQATQAALALSASPLEPAAVEWVSGDAGSPGALHVRVDGAPTALVTSSRRLGDLLAGLGIAAAPLSDADASSTWRAHAEAVLGTADETVLRVAGLPADFASLAAQLQQAADAAGVELALVSSTTLGMHTVRLRGATPHGHADVLTALRAHAREQGASVLLRSRARKLDALVDPLGPPPSSVAVLRRVKAQFDPAGRCAPGRFLPWY